MTNRMLLDRLCMSLILSNMFSQFRWAVHIFHIEYTTLNQATCFFCCAQRKIFTSAGVAGWHRAFVFTAVWFAVFMIQNGPKHVTC